MEISGKQYKVEQDRVLKVDHLSQEEGSDFTLDSVLSINNDGNSVFGAPFVPKAEVLFQILSHGKDKKITVFRYRKRKGYHRKRGHRQQYSLLKVVSIKVS